MGLYKKGVLGFFRGKVGTVVGAIWNGIHYMRSLPDIATDNPSVAQINVRLRLALVSGFLKLIKAQIQEGYQAFTDGVTPMNAATSYTLKHAVAGTAPNYTINYPEVVLSAGDLDQALLPEMETETGQKVAVSWVNDTNLQFGLPTDKVTVVAYNPLKNRFVLARTSVMRSALTYTLQLPADYAGDEVHVWMNFVSADGKKVSDSSYVGEILVV